jgi:hypothetical protein
MVTDGNDWYYHLHKHRYFLLNHPMCLKISSIDGYSTKHSNALKYVTRRTVVDRQPLYDNVRIAASSCRRAYLYRTSSAVCQTLLSPRLYRPMIEGSTWGKNKLWTEVITVKLAVLPSVSLEGQSKTTKHSCQSIRCPFTCKFNLNWRKVLQLRNNFLYGADTLTLRKVDVKYLGSFEMWCWGGVEISWANRVRNEVL